MKISKLTLVLIGFIIVGVLSIMLYKGCNTPAPTSQTKAIDSLKQVMHQDSVQYAARYQQQSSLINSLIQAKDSLESGYESAKAQVVAKGSTIMSLNNRLKAAQVAKDTSNTLAKCDSLSKEVDVAYQLVWNAGRTVDSMIVVNDQLKEAQATALKDARDQIDKTRQAATGLVQNYEAQHVDDVKALKRAKRGRGVFALAGAVVGGGIRSFVK